MTKKYYSKRWFPRNLVKYRFTDFTRTDFKQKKMNYGKKMYLIDENDFNVIWSNKL